ncbi:PP-loop family protein [Roseivivax sediminis]|uniref:PP-loop family protein n=1 Tax=Roseivivax sediminis TaxID=936889 RepID=A0A1I1UIA5_9RHOB|nr:PP-loop family protein [Roseivivax sediminis]
MADNGSPPSMPLLSSLFSRVTSARASFGPDTSPDASARRVFTSGLDAWRIAREEGCSAVVLGHHRDDILETFFMNLFHGGRRATMPPKLVNEGGDLFLYRPLAHVAEADCGKFARAMDYPIILCGSRDGLQRQQVKQILDGWERNSPGRRQVMVRALMNARHSHLLDPALFDFAGLERRAETAPDDAPRLSESH